MKKYSTQLAGLILAGGRSRRMRFVDKSFKKIGNNFLLDYSILRLSLQLDLILINSNVMNNKKLYNNCNILKDCFKGHLGPLAGILTGLKWIKKHKKNISWLITIPVDSPFFPENLVEKFFSNKTKSKIVLAQSSDRIHPVFGMWHIDLLYPLEDALLKNVRKIDDFTKLFKIKVVKFPFIDYDPFFNINNEDDLTKATEIYNLIKLKGEKKDEFC